VLYSFCSKTNCSDGALPEASLTFVGTGLFGTTYNGGAANKGVVFKLSPAGTLTVLHSFNGKNGANPNAGLIADSSGNLYGTTFFGGNTSAACGTNGCGVVFKHSPGGTYTVLHSLYGQRRG
jgi:uncharacterized repeat protein (TIGR03803 family)